MEKVELVTGLLDANDLVARQNRERFHAAGLYVINIMGSPGAGKTTLLERTIAGLADCVALGVIEGDIATTKDAERIQTAGAKVVQINTQGACHLDAAMVAKATADLPLAKLELLVVENVGNLVCPAEFDLGETMKIMVLSVTEGNDKPWKYPLMFHEAQVILLNKVDLLPYTDFSVEQFHRDIAAINPGAAVFAVSARTGEGIRGWCDWLYGTVKGAAGHP